MKVCRGTTFRNKKNVKTNKNNKKSMESKELFKMVRKFKTKESW